MRKILSRKNVARIILIGWISMFLVMNLGVVFAEVESTTTSVLPATTADLTTCQGKEMNPDILGKTDVEGKLKEGGKEMRDLLGCAIKTGNIKLYMVPYFIRTVLEFVIGVSGLACVGAIIFGGFSYLFAGISEDKEKGKKAIQYGVIGMVLTLLAWAIVNIVMSLLTM